MKKELRRSTTDRVFAGVCGGLGEYFGIDSNIVRVLWVLFALGGKRPIGLHYLRSVDSRRIYLVRTASFASESRSFFGSRARKASKSFSASFLLPSSA